jgi:hypothetical protein
MARVHKPTNDQFAAHLRSKLGEDYAVTYVQPKTKDGEPQENAGFYSIQHIPSGMSENLAMRLRSPSRFRTTYSGATPQVNEYAPEIMTERRDSSYVISGTWESRYTETADGTWGAEDRFRSPTETLAEVIKAGFHHTIRARERGMAHADVRGSIFKLLTEGSEEQEEYAVAPGALLMGKQDSPASLRSAAASIGLVTKTNPNLDTNIIAQKSRLMEWRRALVSGALGEKDNLEQQELLESMRSGGFTQDRDNVNRLAPAGQGYISDPETGIPMIYLPTKKFAKHETLVNRGRQQLTPLGPDLMPLEASEVTGFGEGAPNYVRTTGDVSERVPETTLAGNILFTPQYPVPGAGMFYPKNITEDIQAYGYKKTLPFSLTRDIAGAIGDKDEFRIALEKGQVLPSNTSFVYGTQKGEEGETEALTPSRMEASSFVVHGQQIRMPRWYSPVSGGLRYDPEMMSPESEKAGLVREVSELQREQMEQRYKVPVILDDLTDTMRLEVSGMALEDAKIGVAGVKSEMIPYQDTPAVTLRNEQGDVTQKIPIHAMTYEFKSFPEIMANTLAAATPEVQTRVLEAYASSLDQSDQQPEAESLREFMQEFAIERAVHPETRLKMDDVARSIGEAKKVERGFVGEFPVHEVAKDIFSRVFMDNRDFSSMTETDLEEFSRTDFNRANLQNLGMGLVGEGMVPAQTYDISPDNLKADLYAYVQAELANRPKEGGLSEAEIEDRFFQTMGISRETGPSGMHTRSFQPMGFLARGIIGPSVEFIGGGEWTAEEIQLGNSIDPEFMSRLGLGSIDLTSEGALSRNQGSYTRTAHAALARVVMANASGGPNSVMLDDALVLTQTQAAEMLRDPEFRTTLDKKQSGTIAGFERFSQKFEELFPDERDVLSRPITVEGTEGFYLPPIAALGRLMTPDPSTDEDRTRFWESVQPTFRNTLEAVAQGDPSGVYRASDRLMARLDNIFGMPEGKQQDIIKGLMKGDAHRTVAHYTYGSELPNDMVAATESLWKAQFRNEAAPQVGDLSEEETSELYKFVSGQKSRFGETPEYVQQQGVPGIFSRYPYVAGTESMVGTRFVTPEHLKRWGINAPIESGAGMQENFYQIGLNVSTRLQGDYDADYGMGSLGLRFRRDREGNLDVSFGGINPETGNVNQALGEQIESLRKSEYPEMMERLYPSEKYRAEFDPLQGMYNDRSAGKGLGPLGTLMGEIGKQFKAADFYDYDTLFKGSQRYAGAKMQMGVSYDFTRSLHAASTVNEWSTEGMLRAARSRASIYQPHLDLTSPIPAPISNMFSSSFLSQKEGEPLSLGWMGPYESEEQFLKGASSFNRNTGLQITPANAPAYLDAMSASIIYPHQRKDGETGELPSPDILAWALAPDEKAAYTPLNEDDRAMLEMNYEALSEMRGKAPTAEYKQAADETYRGVSLFEALQPAYNAPMEGTDREQKMARAAAMKTAVRDWYGANYQGENAGDFYKSNLFTAAFSKSYNRKLERDPGFVVPAEFSGSATGRDLIDRSSKWQTLFNLERGRLSPGHSMIELMQSLGEQPNRSVAATFYQGLIQNTLGFRSARTEEQQSALYDRVMSDPIQIRSSLLGGITTPRYDANTPLGKLGPRHGFNKDAASSVLYSLTDALGISPRESNAFVGSILASESYDDIVRGINTEAKLGSIMSGELPGGERWFSTSQATWDWDANALTTKPASGDPGQRRRSAFTLMTTVPGEDGGELKVELGATPDFWRLTRDPDTGELMVTFLEQKTPRAGTTRADVSADLEGQFMTVYETTKRGQRTATQAKPQTRLAPYILSKMNEMIDVEGEEGFQAQKLREIVATHVPEPMVAETYRALRAGRGASQIIVPQEGGEFFQAIEERDPERILKEVNDDPYATYYRPTPESLAETENLITAAAQTVARERPGLMRWFGKMADAIPGYWKGRQEAERAKGDKADPMVLKQAEAAIGVARRHGAALRSIGSTAEAEITIANLPDHRLRSPAYDARQQFGPATSQMVGKVNMAPEVYENMIAGMKGQVEEATQAGKGFSLQADPRMGGLEVQARAYGEIANTMGFRAAIDLGEDQAQLSFSPLPAAPTPPQMPPPPEVPVPPAPQPTGTEVLLAANYGQRRVLELQKAGYQEEQRMVGERINMLRKAEQEGRAMPAGTIPRITKAMRQQLVQQGMDAETVKKMPRAEVWKNLTGGNPQMTPLQQAEQQFDQLDARITGIDTQLTHVDENRARIPNEPSMMVTPEDQAEYEGKVSQYKQDYAAWEQQGKAQYEQELSSWEAQKITVNRPAQAQQATQTAESGPLQSIDTQAQQVQQAQQSAPAGPRRHARGPRPPARERDTDRGWQISEIEIEGEKHYSATAYFGTDTEADLFQATTQTEGLSSRVFPPVKTAEGEAPTEFAVGVLGRDRAQLVQGLEAARQMASGMLEPAQKWGTEAVRPKMNRQPVQSAQPVQAQASAPTPAAQVAQAQQAAQATGQVAPAIDPGVDAVQRIPLPERPLNQGGAESGGGTRERRGTGSERRPSRETAQALPTAQVQTFLTYHDSQRKFIEEQATALRQELGVDERGSVGEAMAKLKPAQRKDILRKYAQGGEAARALNAFARQARSVNQAGSFDPAIVPEDTWVEKMRESVETGQPFGLDITDLLNIPTQMSEADKRSDQWTKQVYGQYLRFEMQGEGTLEKIKTALGMSPDQSLDEVLTGGGIGAGFTPPQGFGALGELLSGDTTVRDQMRRALKLTKGVENTPLGKMLGETAPEVLQVAELGRQLMGTGDSAFEELDRAQKAETASSAVRPEIETQNLDRLLQISGELSKTFEDLQSKTIDSTEALGKIEQLQREWAVEQKQTKVDTAAAPLVDAGILAPYQPRQGGATRYGAGTVTATTPEQKAQLSAYQEARNDQEEALLKAMPEGDRDRGLVGGLRKALGGFGLMYMRSVSGIATQGLGYGRDQRMAMEQTVAAATAGATGAGAMPYNQDTYLQNRLALAGAAIDPRVSAQMLRAEVPFLRDATGFAAAGLGSFAMMQQMAQWGGPTSGAYKFATQGRTIGGMKFTAPGVAALVATGALLGSAGANMRDEEGLAYRTSMQYGGTTSEYLGSLFSTDTISSGLKMGDEGYRSRLGEFAYTRSAMRSGAGATPYEMAQMAAAAGQYNVDAPQRGRGAPLWSPSQTTALLPVQDLAPEELTRLYSAQTKTAIGEMPHVPMETMSSVMAFAQRHQVDIGDKKLLERLASQFQYGLADEKVVSSILSASGYSVGQQMAPGASGTTSLLAENVQALANMGMQSNQQAVYLAGLQFAQQAGSAAMYVGGFGAFGSQPVTQGSQLAKLEEWGLQAGTPSEGLNLMALQNWVRDLQAGRQAPEPAIRNISDPVALRMAEMAESRKAEQQSAEIAMQDFQQKYFKDILDPSERLAVAAPLAEDDLTGADQERYITRQEMLAAIRKERETLGLEYDRPDYDRFAQMNEGQLREQQERIGIMRATSDTFRARGVGEGMIEDYVKRFDQEDILELRRSGERYGAASEIAGGLGRAFGMDSRQRESAYAQFRTMADQGQFTSFTQSLYARAAQYDPQALTYLQSKGMNIPGLDEQVSPIFATGDVGGFGPLAGVATGLAQFTTSGNMGNPATGGMTAQQWLPKLMPQGADAFLASGAGQAFAQGYQLPGSDMVVGGNMGMQAYMQDLAFKHQMQSINNASAQQALQYAFNTGIGIDAYKTVNPQTGGQFNIQAPSYGFSAGGTSFQSAGGGLWGIQDAMQNMGWAQQQFQFDFQQRQMRMQDQHFMQNTLLGRRQQVQGREWAREDWAYQDQTRGMQWGWKVEDFQEQKRFMTGRDRRLAERQMKRDTIMHGVEGEQIDRQRGRQQETWRMEDERYKLQIEQHKEQLAMQKEQMEVSREFFEERKKLEVSQLELTRALWVEQNALQAAAIEAQRQYAIEAKQIQEMQNVIQLAQVIINSNLQDNIKGLEEGTITWSELTQKTTRDLFSWAEKIDQVVSKSYTNTTPPSGQSNLWPHQKKAIGGSVSAGMIYEINEAGEQEFFQPHVSGEIIPLSSGSYNPWSTTNLTAAPETSLSATNQPVSVVINVGGQYLKTVIIDTVNQEIDI